MGLNLQRAASCVVCLDLPWNPAVLEQRVGRIYRIGQKHPIEVYHLVSETGIEGRIAGLIGDKQALFRGLFDGSSDEVRFDRSGSFMGRLERIVKPVEVPELDEEAEEPDEIEPPAATASPRPAGEEGLKTEDVEPERRPPAQESGSAAEAPPSGARIRSMLSIIEVRRTPAGGIAIEAPPEAAETLAAMFSGMAELLSRAANDDSAREDRSPPG